MSFPKSVLVAITCILVSTPLFAQTSTPRRATSPATASRLPASSSPSPRTSSASTSREQPAIYRAPTTQRAQPASYASEVPPELYETEPYAVGPSSSDYGPACDGCGGPSCGTQGCCAPGCFTGWGCCDLYVRAEYLMWWSNGANAPALVTESLPGIPQANAGVLGSPGTSILYGDENLDSDLRSGILFGIGGWCDPGHTIGWEVNYAYLGEDNQDFYGDNTTSTILARPFFNTQTGAQDSRLINYPGLVSGSVGIDATTEFQSLEAVIRSCFMQSCYGRTDFILGYRYANLTEQVRIEESTLALSGVIAGTTIDIVDDFKTLNEFNGVNLGFITERRINPCWSYEFTAKVALGTTKSTGTIRGQRTTTNTLGTSTTNGGLLALDTNIGDYSQTAFSAMPELGIQLRYDLNPCWSATFGYSVRAITNTMRAAEQIDTTINPTQIPPGTFTGANRPDFLFGESVFVAQGLNFGLQCAF